MRSPRAFAPVFVAAWLLAAKGVGQVSSATGSIYGRALDPHGNVVPGVTATLTRPGASRTATSDERGDFHFLSLSPGGYSVTLKRDGFETVRRDVIVAPRGSSVFSITLPVAGASETVIVGSDYVGLDDRKLDIGASFGRTELEDIPTARTPWAILQQVPGVLFPGPNVGGVLEAPRPIFIGKGSDSSQNTYQLDGIPVSLGGVPPFFFDFDSLSNIEVSTGGADPALETPGVTVSLVTKRGTNTLRGSARGLYTGRIGWDYGVETGGPLWKDRLWLWAAFAHNDYLAEDFGLRSRESIRSSVTLANWNAKLNAQVLPANTLALGYTNFERTTLGWLLDEDRDDASNSNNLRPGQAYTVQDSHVFSAKLFASGNLSYVTNASANTPRGGSDVQAILGEDRIFRHSYASRFINDDKHQASAQVSSFFETGRVRHEVKFGFGYRHVRFGVASSWPADQIWGDQFSKVASITRLQDVNAELNAFDAFMGDTIRVGDLTLNVGSRFDYAQGKNLPSHVPANPVFPTILPAVQYAGDSGFPITWRQFQPRVSAAYALPDSRTLVRASYSRFADQLDSPTALQVNAFPAIAERRFAWDDANRNGFVERGEIDISKDLYLGTNVDIRNPGSSVQINRIAEDLRPPTTDEFILGVERQISTELSASLTYTHRMSRGFLITPWAGTTLDSYVHLGNATGTAVGVDGYVLSFDEPYYGLVKCPPPCGTVLENRPDATQTYDGVEFQVQKQFAHGWMARVSFAYNDWRQRIRSAAIVNPNNETPGINATGAAAPIGINARWQFNVSGTFPLPLGAVGGISLFGREGFPIPYIVEATTEDLKQNYLSLQIGPVDRYRYPDLYQLDLQLSRVVRLGAGVTVTPQLDCFNALNRRTVLARQTVVGVYDLKTVPHFDASREDFNSPVERVAPRVFRGGVRIAF